MFQEDHWFSIGRLVVIEEASDKFSCDLVLDGPEKEKCRSNVNLSDKSEFTR